MNFRNDPSRKRDMKRDTSRMSSLEYYSVKARSLIQSYIELTYPSSTSHKGIATMVSKEWSLDEKSSEIEETLARINGLLEQQGNNPAYLKGSMSLLLEHETMLLIARLGFQRTSGVIFDQQILLFKRLIKLLLTPDSILNESTFAFIPQTKLLSTISQCLGIYTVNLLDFTDIQDQRIKFVLSSIPSVLAVYERYPRLLEIWLETFSSEYEKFQHLINSEPRLLQADFKVLEFIPLYDFLLLALFENKDYNFNARMCFCRLVKLLSNEKNNFRENILTKWFIKYGEIPKILILQFHRTYECILKTSMTLNDYKSLCCIFLDVIICLKPELQMIIIEKLQNDFFLPIWKTRKSTNHNAYDISIITIECMLPRIEDIIIQKYILAFFDEKNLTSLLYDNEPEGEYHQKLIKLFGLLNEITSNSKSKVIVHKLFCQIDCFEFSNESEKELSALRIKAMLVDENRFEMSTMIEANTFEVDLERLRKVFKAFHQQSYLIFDEKKLLPQIISSTMLTFFQNDTKLNENVCKLIISLLEYGSGMITQLILPSENVQINDMNLIISFLVDAFIDYGDTIFYYQNQKYETMDSAKTSRIREHEYLKPSKTLLDLLTIEISSPKKKYIEHDLLMPNMQLFQSFFSDAYICCKIRSIIQKKTQLQLS